MQFDIQQALRNLDIEVKPFGYTGEMGVPGPTVGDVRGYSHERWLSISPEERWPTFVTFHEMTHILRGHTMLHKKFGAEKVIDRSRMPSLATIAMMDYKEQHHDIFEAECHITAIIAAQLTNTPFDFKREMDHLEHCYTRGRRIPKDVIARAQQTAQKIAAAGKVDQRSLSFGRGWVAA